MNVVYLREPEDICPSEFPEDPHHDCKETIDYLERDNAALKLFISGQEAENAELKSQIERLEIINKQMLEALVWVDGISCSLPTFFFEDGEDKDGNACESISDCVKNALEAAKGGK